MPEGLTIREADGRTDADACVDCRVLARQPSRNQRPKAPSFLAVRYPWPTR